jgi:hypothetical protein
MLYVCNGFLTSWRLPIRNRNSPLPIHFLPLLSLPMRKWFPSIHLALGLPLSFLPGGTCLGHMLSDIPCMRKVFQIQYVDPTIYITYTHRIVVFCTSFLYGKLFFWLMKFYFVFLRYSAYSILCNNELIHLSVVYLTTLTVAQTVTAA